jgi:hypothetical protein
MNLDKFEGTKNLARLSTLLRNPQLWPTGFVWDYEHIDQCALGLAGRLWPHIVVLDHLHMDGPRARIVDSSLAMKNFAIDEERFNRIFYALHINRTVSVLHFWKRDMRITDVTPNMVAAEIDAYLGTSVSTSERAFV